MSVQTPPLKSLPLRDFSGGPNIRDAASELGQNECVDAWNVTFDERGGVGSRLGYVKYNATAFTGAGGVVKNVYYSGILENVITQAGADLYLGTTNTSRKLFTTSGRVVFADFNNKVYAGHPVDGLFHSLDGITWTAVADADRPTTCQAIAVWQNQLYVVPFNSTRVQWSDIGDGTAWTANAWVDLREKDDENILALAGASGIDIAGRQGLLAFKRESTYRIFDSTTGEYATIDSTVGAASNLAVTQVGFRTIALSEHGIFETDGVSGMRDVSERFAPLWDAGQINLAQLDLFCAGTRKDRAYFSLPRAGSTANDLSLEYHPQQGWIAPGSNAMSCYTTFGDDTEKLYGGHPSTSGRVYYLYSGGTDDGVAIASRFQSRWLDLNDGFLAQLWQVRIHGRSDDDITAEVLKDYAASGGDSRSVTFASTILTYDSGETYDSGIFYLEPVLQATVAKYSFGTCRQFSFKITASTSTTVAGASLFGGAASTELGAWALYGLEALNVPLGIA